MKLFSAILIGFGALTLQGCTSEVDAAKIYTRDGLIYKVGDDSPFSGRVMRYQVNVLDTYNLGTCTLDVKKGLVDGKLVCTSNEGSKTTEAEFTAGKKSGLERVWDAKSGKLKSSIEWKAGLQHGLEQRFNPENGKLIASTEWEGGRKNGVGKTWDATGETLQSELQWKNDKKTGYENTERYSMNYRDGRQDGVQKRFGFRGDGSRYLESEVSFKDGLFDGPTRSWDEAGKLVTERFYKNNVEVPKPQEGLSQGNSEYVTGNPTTDACVELKVNAYRKEKGRDAAINHDQMIDWINRC
ncbi:toxin-antitoxin system YwqK family antitoxin [Polaromonas sp. SP1]|nr:toxin-antitoxin system YwqK family antitoxin [Polaromonas sp. SP1]